MMTYEDYARNGHALEKLFLAIDKLNIVNHANISAWTEGTLEPGCKCGHCHGPNMYILEIYIESGDTSYYDDRETE